MMASKARLFGDDTALSAILSSDDPREQKHPGRQVCHLDHDLWQTECETSYYMAILRSSPKRGEALPRTSSPDCWCGQNLLGQALEHTREILRRDTTAPLSNPAPETPVPRDDIGDTVFEVDPVTHLRPDTDPPSANTQTATLSACNDSVPDDHAPEVRLAQE